MLLEHFSERRGYLHLLPGINTHSLFVIHPLKSGNTINCISLTWQRMSEVLYVGTKRPASREMSGCKMASACGTLLVTFSCARDRYFRLSLEKTCLSLQGSAPELVSVSLSAAFSIWILSRKPSCLAALSEHLLGLLICTPQLLFFLALGEGLPISWQCCHSCLCGYWQHITLQIHLRVVASFLLLLFDYSRYINWGEWSS